MSPPEHLASLEADCAAIADVLARAGGEPPVPACPGWTVADLVAHHGRIHRWCRVAVLEGHGHHEPAPAPSSPADLLGWYRAGAAALLATLRDTPPDHPCWTLWPPGHAGFWRRRQALEAAVHRWDAETAVGEAPTPDPLLAADGVAEVVTGFTPRQVRLGRIAPLPHSVRLRSGDRTWLLGEGAPAAGEVAGEPADLLLLLWRRRSLDDGRRFSVSGDAAAVAAVLDRALTP